MNSLINKKNISLPSFDRGETEALDDEQTKTFLSFVLIIRGKKKPFDEIFLFDREFDQREIRGIEDIVRSFFYRFVFLTDEFLSLFDNSFSIGNRKTYFSLIIKDKIHILHF